jgi:hypothetical protein
MMPARILVGTFVAVAAAVIAPGSGRDTSVATAANAVIRGRVELRQTSGDPAARVSVSDLGMGSMHAPADRRAVVYLDPAPRAAFDVREEPRPRLDQRNETFVPQIIEIVAVTTVEFPNSDLTVVNVFSL